MENGHKSDSRGALIVLEGLDRSGKTSQSSRLISYLEGLSHSVESWRFPDRNTGVGQMISSYLTNKSQLDDHAIHLLFSANRWEKRFVSLSHATCGVWLFLRSYENPKSESHIQLELLLLVVCIHFNNQNCSAHHSMCLSLVVTIKIELMQL